MAALTELCAQILPLLVFAVAIGGWLFVARHDKGRLAVRAIFGDLGREPLASSR